MNIAAIRRVPAAEIELARTYAPGTAERNELKAKFDQMAGERIDIPLVIGGKEIRTGNRATANAARPPARTRRLAQGGLEAEPYAVGKRASGERDVRSAARLPLSLMATE